jgi:hypothetical protein
MGNSRDTKDPAWRSVLPRVFTVLVIHLVTTVGLFSLALWYGRSTYGPANDHPASVSEGLGPVVIYGLPLAALAGFIGLVLAVGFWVATLLWPSRFRNQRAEALALKIGWAIVLTAVFLLTVTIMVIE